MVRKTCIVLSIVAIVDLVDAELDFAIHVKEGGAEAAERIARKHGMENMGEVRIKFYPKKSSAFALL